MIKKHSDGITHHYFTFRNTMSELRQLLQGLQLDYSALCNLVASTTIIIWDIFLTFDEEVKFIWSNFKFTLVKVLYVTVRYLAVIVFWYGCSSSRPANLLGWPRLHCPHSAINFAFFGDPQRFKFCQAILWIISFAGSFTAACSNILLIQRGCI